MPFIAGLSNATAQDVLAPPPPGYSIDTSMPFDPLSPETDPDLDALDILTTAPELGLEALKWGIANLDPRFLYRMNYSEGLRSNRETTTKTLIHELHPGIKIDIGKLWDINYAPIARFYMSDRFRDTFNHSVRFSGGTSYGDWSFGVRQSYANTEDPSTETGSQTQREVFMTGLNAGYVFNSKVSLSLGLSQNLRFIGGDSERASFSDSMTWSTMNWLNYRIFPRIGVGLGAGATFTDVEQGSDMLSEQVLGRVSWSVQQKLSLSASGGIDIRQYLDSDASGSMSPLFTISAQYRLFEHTSLSLSGSRSVSASAFRNTVSESTRVRASLTQRLVGRLNLTVGGGIRNSSYSNTLSDLETTREDDGTFYDVRLGTGFFKRATASVFYRHNENQSSGSGFGYSSNQMGLEVGYKF